MINLKKIFSASLISIMLIMLTPYSNNLIAGSREESLAEFLKTTENIQASMKYPGMKLAMNYNNKPSQKLDAMTPIVIKAVENISTKDIVNGSIINFAVLNDVKTKNGTLAIKANSPVTAQITFAKKKSFIGMAGDLTVSDFHTTTVDGTYVPLVGNLSQKGDDKIVLSVVLSVLICPLFLFLKGEDAKVTAGTTKPAYTASDVYFNPAAL